MLRLRLVVSQNTQRNRFNRSWLQVKYYIRIALRLNWWNSCGFHQSLFSSSSYSGNVPWSLDSVIVYIGSVNVYYDSDHWSLIMLFFGNIWKKFKDIDWNYSWRNTRCYTTQPILATRHFLVRVFLAKEMVSERSVITTYNEAHGLVNKLYNFVYKYCRKFEKALLKSTVI